MRQDGLLPGQPKVLEYLHEHDGCTQKQLGEGCALDKSSITGLLTRMDQQGLVRRQTAADDRRVSLVCLTEGRPETGRARAAGLRRGRRAGVGRHPAGERARRSCKPCGTLSQIFRTRVGKDGK